MMYLVICVVILTGLWFRSRVEVGRLQKQLKAVQFKLEMEELTTAMWYQQARMYVERAQKWHEEYKKEAVGLEMALDLMHEELYRVSEN